MANKHLIPVTVALTVAIIGASVLFGMNFSKTAVRNDGILKISRQALHRAGAVATPTAPIE